MKIRRIIHTLEVSRTTEVIPVDLLLPGDVSECFGLQAIPVGVFPSAQEVIPNLGEYALEFGAKEVHPVNALVSYIQPNAVDDENHNRLGLLPLSVPISSNRLVTGYYRDLGTMGDAFTTYKVKLIFHCERK